MIKKISDRLLLMSELKKIVKYLLLIVLFISFAGCVPTQKNHYYEKRKKSSRINTSQLGRNRYYFTADYQKRLVKSYKRK